MKLKANNYFLKSFEEIGLIGKHFSVYNVNGNLIREDCYINENGYVCTGSNELWSITMGLLTGLYSYEITPKKKKLRDLTKDEWDKWKHVDCVKNYNSDCDNCIFRNVPCGSSGGENSWFNNKELYSDKFLNQEIEVEE